MTEKLYYGQGYQTTFTATVLSCEKGKQGFQVILDQTLFYPEGGGQPADQGKLGEATVLDVHEKDGIILHETDVSLSVGTTVSGEIFWPRRFDLMQNHSGEHILSGVICGKYHCHNVGFHMGKDKITIDFDIKIPNEDLDELEERANEAIWKNIPIDASFPDERTLEQLDYRSKIALTGEVRIVTAGEYDCCACCGTHVARAGEIGIIKIVGAQNYKGGTRLEILSGKRALLHYREKNAAADAVGRAMSIPGEKIAPAVEALLAERDELIQELGRLKWEIFHQKAEELPKEAKDILYFAQGLSGKDMTHFADVLAQKSGGRALVLTPAAEGFAFVLISDKGDAKELAEEMKQAFDCKGGGKPVAVQGRLRGEKEKILEFFKEKDFFVSA